MIIKNFGNNDIVETMEFSVKLYDETGDKIGDGIEISTEDDVFRLDNTFVQHLFGCYAIAEPGTSTEPVVRDGATYDFKMTDGGAAMITKHQDGDELILGLTNFELSEITKWSASDDCGKQKLHFAPKE